MSLSIELQHQTRGGAVEIDDIRSNRVLPAELEALETSAAQLLPEDSFGQVGVLPQFAGSFASGGVSVARLHGRTLLAPHPRPLSPRGRGEEEKTFYC